MNQSEDSAFINGSSLITKKQRQYIKQTLQKTDYILNKLRTKTQLNAQKNTIKTKEKSNYLQQNQLYSIDKHYTILLKCIEIQIKKSYHIFLQPHTQEYFYFDMGLHIFPLILEISKISFQGLLFLGFNQEYPGIQKPAKNQHDPLSQRKILIKKIQNIQIHQPGNRNVNKIYFLFSSTKKPLNLNFKLKHSISKDNLAQSLPKPKKNFFELMDQKLKAPVKKIRVKTELSPQFSMTKFSYLQKLQRISIDQQLLTFTSKFSINNQKYQNDGFTELKNATTDLFFIHKNKFESLNHQNIDLNASLSQTKFKNKSINSFLRTYVNFSSEEKHQISQKNIKELSQHKQKTQRLYKLVQKFKSCISVMKQEHDEQKLKQKKLVKNISVLLKLYKFMEISHTNFIKRKIYLNSCFRTFINVNKFTKKLKSKRQISKNLVAQNCIRYVYGLLLLTNLLASTLWQRSEDKSNKIMFDTFQKLFSSFKLRQSFQKSQDYLQKIIKIQTIYKQRLKCQKKMLRIYCLTNVDNLIEKLPHLNKFQKSFIDRKIFQSLISVYLRDQNLKFNERELIYRKQIKQREQYINIKMKIIQQAKMQESNKLKRKSPYKNDKKKDKNELQIPPIPLKPYKSLFRNLNILETMIRNWFQLQNFMWLKKQKAKKWY